MLMKTAHVKASCSVLL